ncbi:MAG: DUF1330 domain-containing protein [Alphaproteobacteria bacterium]|nr:DUF1330 domain-containing protein [Alphaproteobacteria bacterium]
MTVYALAQVKITDAEAYTAYTAKTPGVVAAFGGKFLVRGGDVGVIEGDAPVEGVRFVLLEFPSKERFDEFYNSADYQEILPIRLENSEGKVWLFEGYEG